MVKKRISFKRVFKVVLSVLLVLFAVIMTIYGAVAFSVDDNDYLSLSAGDSVVSSFVVVGYPAEDVSVRSNSEWVSFDSDGEVFDRVLDLSDNIEDEALYVEYFVNVPANADVGVYRAIIVVSSLSDSRIVNVKLSVQNRAFSGVEKFFRNKSFTTTLAVVLVVVLGVVVMGLFMNGGKK